MTNICIVDRVYALYDYEGTTNNGNSKLSINRLTERHIRVNEGDELEVLEDDDEHLWKVNSITVSRTI